jgi:HK97 family phage prohead protease
MEKRVFPIVEIRVEEGSRMVSGYAAVFNSPSVPMGNVIEKIARGAFSSSINSKDICALWNHNPDYVLGRTGAKTLTVTEDDKGLAFRLDLPKSTWGDAVLEAINRRDVEGMSFGFMLKQDDWTKGSDGKWNRTILDVELIEVSPTAWPAYPATSVDARSTKEFEDLLAKAIAGAEAKEQEIALQKNKALRSQLLATSAGILKETAKLYS